MNGSAQGGQNPHLRDRFAASIAVWIVTSQLIWPPHATNDGLH